MRSRKTIEREAEEYGDPSPWILEVLLDIREQLNSPSKPKV